MANRAQQYGVQDTEDCRVHADTERQGTHHDQAEPGTFEKLAKGKARSDQRAISASQHVRCQGVFCRMPFGTEGLARTAAEGGVRLRDSGDRERTHFRKEFKP